MSLSSSVTVLGILILDIRCAATKGPGPPEPDKLRENAQRSRNCTHLAAAITRGTMSDDRRWRPRSQMT